MRFCHCKKGTCGAPKPEWCIGNRLADMSEKDALYAQLLALQDEYRTRADPIVKRLMHMLAAEPLKPIIVSLDEVPEGLRRLMDLGAMDDFRQITAAKSDETPDK